MADTENSILEEGIPEISLALSVDNNIPTPVDTTLSISGEAADAKATGDAISALQTTLEAAIAALFPVGAIYVSTSSSAPDFFGTWTEFVMPATWGDIEDGMRSYTNGTGTGNLHFWRRTA